MGRKKHIIDSLEEFKKETEKSMPISKIIFFGSRATGKARKYSDVDMIVVSPEFGDMKFRERATRMYDYWNLDYPVDFLCYTPEEFEKKKTGIGIIHEAVKAGIEI